MTEWFIRLQKISISTCTLRRVVRPGFCGGREWGGEVSETKIFNTSVPEPAVTGHVKTTPQMPVLAIKKHIRTIIIIAFPTVSKDILVFLLFYMYKESMNQTWSFLGERVLDQKGHCNMDIGIFWSITVNYEKLHHVLLTYM